MTKEEILNLVELFNLETYNVNDKSFCIKGVNGAATLVYYAADPITTIKNHLMQMGRDYTTNGKDWQFAEKSEYYRLDDEINIGSKFSLLAPLYQQAFRFFREKHEEAELECLKKLIEIVESKS